MAVSARCLGRLLETVALMALASCTAEPVPTGWTQLVHTEGQEQPIPKAWLQDAEARVAHSLKLPASVPKPVPFDFDKAQWRSWLPNVPSVSVQYFLHLCDTEAGQWIFKTVRNVDGLYFARPQGPPPSGLLEDRFGPEMPWMQRQFVLKGDRSPLQEADWLIQPPIYNYRFLEEPRRDVKWQANIDQPYIRLHGYTREIFVKPGQVVAALNEKTPMEVTGISQRSATYGYTWRGIVRPRDREHGIAGGEMIIYDLRTKVVLGVRRQFLITGKNPRRSGEVAWEVAASCRLLPSNGLSGEFSQFAFDVLQTEEPSSTKRR